jgi:CRISPR-associated protein Cas5d
VEIIEDGPIPKSQLRGKRELGWMLYDMDYSDPKDIQPQFFNAELFDGILDLSRIELVR